MLVLRFLVFKSEEVGEKFFKEKFVLKYLLFVVWLLCKVGLIFIFLFCVILLIFIFVILIWYGINEIFLI